MLLVKSGGRAGGVRGGKVAVGSEVSVGSGVGVMMSANAVCTAWVMSKLISGVGVDAGLHATKIMATKLNLSKPRES